MVHDKLFGFVRAVKKCWLKNVGVNALLPMSCRLCFSKTFQSDNHVYFNVNNSISDFFI